jgi:apolipoprotein N-acyltransferase
MVDLAGRVMLLWGWRRALVAFLAGALAVLSQPPFNFFAVCFVSFPVLVWLLDGAVGKGDAGPVGKLLPAALTGWWFGFGYFVAGLWWIGNALLVDAASFAWAVPFAVIGLPAALAIFYALAAVLARLVWSDGLGRILALAFGFGVAEWLRTIVLTGFPWNAIGYAAMPVPLLMQADAVVGLYAMNTLAVFVFAAPALLAGRHHRRIGLALAVALVAVDVGFGAWRLHTAPPLAAGPEVRVVQPSVPQDLKWDPAVREEIFDKLIAMSAAPPAAGRPRPSIIVWPETAVPYILSDTPGALARIGDMLAPGQVLLTGAVREEPAAGGGPAHYYNSLYSIGDSGQIIDAADKVHLVPFGEYMPLDGFLRLFGMEQIAEGPGGFTAGVRRHSLKIADKLYVLPLVCYEAIFPEELEFSGPRPSAIVNVTNDAWFGRTPGPYQHLREAQLRAVEEGLPLIRAANNGLSAVVDPYGRIVDGLALDATGTIDVAIPLNDAPFRNTPPGPSFAWIILSLFLVVAAALNWTSKERNIDS